MIVRLARTAKKESVLYDEGLFAEDITKPVLTKAWKELLIKMQTLSCEKNNKLVNEYHDYCRQQIYASDERKDDVHRKKLLKELKKNMTETHNINCFVNNFGFDYELSEFLKDNFKKITAEVTNT